MEPYDITNREPFNLVEKTFLFIVERIKYFLIILLLMFLLYVHYYSFPVAALTTFLHFLLAIIALAVTLLLIPFYIKEKQVERTLEPERYTQQIEQAVDNSPIPVLPVSEIFRTTSTNQINEQLQEMMFDNDDLTSLAQLKEPSDYFATIQHMMYKPDPKSAFCDLLITQPDVPGFRMIVAPFLTDFASIPFGQKTGSYARAALVHDWGYSYHPQRNYNGKKDCDKEMLHIMRKDGTTPFTRSYIYLGLRLFGTYSYMTAPIRRKKLNDILSNPFFEQQYMHALSSQLTFTALAFERINLLQEGTAESLFKDISSSAMEIINNKTRT